MGKIKLAIPVDSFLGKFPSSYGFQFEQGPRVFIPFSQSCDFVEGAETIHIWCEEWLIILNGLDIFVDESAGGQVR